MQLQKPIIYTHRKEVPVDAKYVNAFESSIEELFFIYNPQCKKENPECKKLLHTFLKEHTIPDVWAYYPWQNTAARIPPEDIYYRLRTSRNRDIITEDEQKKYRDIRVGVAGLSVGSSVALSLAISGGAKYMKIADFDTLEITNLNRIRATLLDAGSNKTEIIARAIWELDPFAELALYTEGLSVENINTFFLQPKIHIYIDEMDNIALKVHSRHIAKKNMIPVIMATDNGDGVIVDVERFDVEPERELFHGLVKDINDEDLKNIDFKEWLKLATQIISPEYLTESMQDSVLKIGTSIPSVPQLGTSAAVAGAAVSYIVRRIANNQEMPSGRYVISFEDTFIPDFRSEESVKKREKKTQAFKKKFVR